MHLPPFRHFSVQIPEMRDKICPMLISVLKREMSRVIHVSRRMLHKRPTPLIDEIIRVDHAGELGADRIYAGQMAVLGKKSNDKLVFVGL